MSTKEEAITSQSVKAEDAQVEDVYGFSHMSSDDETWRKLEKKIVRRLDMTLMPVVWVLYLFNYLDRNNISQAKLDNFEADLGLKGEDFNIAVSILNVGYILMQLPSNMILTRVRPSLYIPFWVAVWSIVSGCTAAVHNFGGLVAVRIILGVCEAPFFPGAFYILSCWYTKKELALRIAILYSGLVLATAISGLLAAGIFAGLSGVHGLAGWRWLFLLEGAATLVLAIIAMFILPDYPTSTTGSGSWLFTDKERQFAMARMARQQVSDQDSNRSVWHGVKLAVTDFRMWTFAFILLCNTTAYGFNYYYPTIVKGFNLGSRTQTLLLTAPPYLVGAIISFGNAFFSDRNNDRGFHISIPMGVAVVGFIISVSTLNVPARYVASFLYVAGCFSANSIIYTWAADSLSQTPEKRACAGALINLLGQFGNIWSPYFFTAGDEPRYIKAYILMVIFAGCGMFTCWIMKWVLHRDNKKLLAAHEGTGDRPNLYQL